MFFISQLVLLFLVFRFLNSGVVSFLFFSRIGLRTRVLFVFGAGLGALGPDRVWGRAGGLILRVFTRGFSVKVEMGLIRCRFGVAKA